MNSYKFDSYPSMRARRVFFLSGGLPKSWRVIWLITSSSSSGRSPRGSTAATPLAQVQQGRGLMRRFQFRHVQPALVDRDVGAALAGLGGDLPERQVQTPSRDLAADPDQAVEQCPEKAPTPPSSAATVRSPSRVL